MKNFILKNANVDDTITDITVENGVVVNLAKTEAAGRDMEGARLVSGLFDIHAHGCMGHDVMDGDALDIMSRYWYSLGVTSWLPTTMTMPYEDILRVSAILPKDEEGKASVVGFHYEGPFFSKRYCGAQNPAWLKNPDMTLLSRAEHLSLLSIAPELEGAMEMIRKAKVVVSLGHSEADYDTTIKAFQNGAVCLTHTFNAMPPLHHRKPGMVGAAIDENAYVQVICDGVHIHPCVVRMLYRLFGAERMILISDAMSATGLSDGEYELGGQAVYVRSGEARLADGALAGSTTPLSVCVQRAISFGIPPRDAYRMASETPAKMMGLKKGKIAVGYDAEFLVLDDDYRIKEVIAAR